MKCSERNLVGGSPPDLYCEIFVAKADVRSVEDFLVAELGMSLRSRPWDVDVVRNMDSRGDWTFDEDFLFWPVLIELEAESASALPGMVARVADLLRALWAAGLPAVAACDFEDQLPWNGGIRRDF